MINVLAIGICFVGQAQGSGERLFAQDIHCGSYCLFIALDALGKAPSTYLELEKSLGEPGKGGYSMLQLQEEAIRRKAHVLGLSTNLENLQHHKEPIVCITVVDNNHFVLIYDIDDQAVSLINSEKPITLNRDVFNSMWNGKVLLLSNLPISLPNANESLLRPSYVLSAAICICLLVAVFTYLQRHKLKTSTVHFQCLGVLLCLLTGCSDNPTSPKDIVTTSSSGSSIQSIQLTPEKKDLGKIFRGSPSQFAEVQVNLHNSSRKRIDVTQILVGCDCTNVTMPNRNIDPDSDSLATIQIRLGSTMEPRSTQIKFLTSDRPDEPSIFTINWQIINPLCTDTDSLFVPSIQPNQQYTTSQNIFLDNINLCDSCNIIAESEQTSIDLKVVMEENLRARSHSTPLSPGRKHKVGKLSIKLPANIDYNVYKDNITLSLKCGTDLRAQFTLPISWKVAPSLTVSPNRLFLGTLPSEQIVSQTLVLRTAGAEPFAILKVEADRPNLLQSWECDPNPDSSKVLTLKFRTPEENGAWRSHVTVSTTSQKTSTAKIPVSGIGFPGKSKSPTNP